MVRQRHIIVRINVTSLPFVKSLGGRLFNWLLSVVISTNDRFMVALRVGDGTPRYLNNLSIGCSGHKVGEYKCVLGTLPTKLIIAVTSLTPVSMPALPTA